MIGDVCAVAIELPAIHAETVFVDTKYRWTFDPVALKISGLALQPIFTLLVLTCEMWVTQVLVPASSAH